MEKDNLLSDSGEESDDLPSFEERVRRLINSKSEVAKKTGSPNNKVTQVYSIPYDEDNNSEIIQPVSLESMSPTCNFTNSPECKVNKNRSPSTKKNVSQIHSISDSDDSDSRETIPFSREKSMSPRSVTPDFPVNEANKKCFNFSVNLPDIPVCDANKKYFNFSSDDDTPQLNKNVKSRKKKNSEAEKEKELRKKMRLEKKKEKEIIKALKASEKEILKSQKPEESIKNMKLVLDHNILYLDGSQSAINCLDTNNLKYCIEQNKCKYSINWYRTVINILTSNDEIIKEESDEIENSVIIVIPNEQFLKMVHAFSQKTKGKTPENVSFEEFIISVKSLYGECDITCVTVGFDKFFRNIKESSFELKSIAKQIHKNATEEALVELQLQSPVNFSFFENMTDFGNYLCQFTKAIAEAPRRKEKQMQKALAFSWYADVDSNCPVKLSKDSSTFIKLWKQQIQQFHNIGPEVAEAIVSRYPTPRSLFKVYKRCVTVKDAENILQDIVVRRNYGPLGTQKRIGPELAYKLYLFFTSKDGNKLLKR